MCILSLIEHIVPSRLWEMLGLVLSWAYHIVHLLLLNCFLISKGIASHLPSILGPFWPRCAQYGYGAFARYA